MIGLKQVRMSKLATVLHSCCYTHAITILVYSLCCVMQGCLRGRFSQLGSECIHKVLAFANRFCLHSASFAHRLQQMLGMPLALHASFLYQKVHAINGFLKHLNVCS